MPGGYDTDPGVICGGTGEARALMAVGVDNDCAGVVILRLSSGGICG